VKLPSVTEALKKLKDKGYVGYERYGLIGLTGRGKSLAEKIYKKHEALYDFLTTILKVKKESAIKEACSMEHYISTGTYRKLKRFVEDSKRQARQTNTRKK